MKRDNVYSWDEYFMGLAYLSSKRSKDPVTQVGACIVSKEKKVVGIGYNGFPFACSDDEFPWEKEGQYNDTKYPYVVHAELNAILNSTKNLKDCILYVSLFPCNECAKAIIQSGISEVVYNDDKNYSSDAALATRKMFDAANIGYRKMEFDIDIKINQK